MVIEGVFGVQADGRVEPKLPVELVPMLFGDRETISLQLPRTPGDAAAAAQAVDGDLLVAGKQRADGDEHDRRPGRHARHRARRWRRRGQRSHRRRRTRR